MLQAIRDCLGWIGLGWPPPAAHGSDTSTQGSQTTGSHSANSSLTSEDLFEAGIGRFEPGKHKGGKVPIYFRGASADQTWLPPPTSPPPFRAK